MREGLTDAALDRLREAFEHPDFTDSRYRIVGRLGSGGMGTVYLAEDTALRRKVAIKVTNLPDNEGKMAARIQREAEIIARLEHPGLVPIHDVGRLEDGRVFYVMKYVQGSRLDDHLLQVVSLTDRLRLFLKLCEAVAFAHAKGVLHRDLKPQNVMVGAFGEVLLMDWSAAKVLNKVLANEEEGFDSLPTHGLHVPSDKAMLPRGAEIDTAHGTVIGTLAYRSPEQADGQVAQLDERTDVYAMGAILYSLLTHRAPLDARQPAFIRPRQVNPRIARPLEAICLQAMAKAAPSRYASVQELAQEVTRFLDGLPVAAYRENLFESLYRLLRRHRFLVLLIVAYLLMRLLVLFIFRR